MLNKLTNQNDGNQAALALYAIELTKHLELAVSSFVQGKDCTPFRCCWDMQFGETLYD